MRQNDYYKVFLEFDQEDSHDYENPENSKYGTDKLMKILYEEIVDFK